MLIYLVLLSVLADTQYDTILDTMEQNSTILRSKAKELSNYLAVHPRESIPMLKVESNMIEIETVINKLHSQHSTLP